MDEIFEVAIVGGGIAGLSASMYSRRLGLNTAVFDAFLGGKITKTDIVENYPGFLKITGFGLADNLKQQALAYKPKIINEFVGKIEKKQDYFIITSNNKSYKSKTIIFATGTDWKKLNVPGEKEFANKGVHYCALCDGNFYKDKIVAVVGAGNAAVKEALVLSNIAKKVYIIVRKENIHPDKANLDNVKKSKNIEVISNTEIKEILGDKKVNSVRLNKEYNGSDILELNGIFIDIGQQPISALVEKLGVKLNDRKEIITDKLAKTSIPGFFAAGDVTDIEMKQAITSASEGCKASYSANEFLKSLS